MGLKRKKKKKKRKKKSSWNRERGDLPVKKGEKNGGCYPIMMISMLKLQNHKFKNECFSFLLHDNNTFTILKMKINNDPD